MDSDNEGGNGEGSSQNNSRGKLNGTGKANDNSAHDILANLEATFQKGRNKDNSNTTMNPLLTRLNQNSAERAHIAAVGHQLGSEGARAPQVIGDFVGLSMNSGSGSGRMMDQIGPELNEALENIRLGGEDDEFNELDAEDDGDGDEEDMTLNFSHELDLQPESSGSGRMNEIISPEAISAASAVDPRKLIGAATGDGSSVPWEAISGFEPSLADDDDELDENDPALEELGLALAPKSKREKKKLQKKSANPVYPPEVQKLLGMANHAYVNRDYKEAVELYQQVIVNHANVFQAWNIMGVIQEELGNTEKALQLYLVAAHLTPKDGALWKKLAVISKADKNDIDALWDRSIMYQILGESHKAIMGFQKILKTKQHYMPALEELVKIYSSLDQDHKRYRENMHQAMVDYEAAYLHYSSLPDRFANPSGDPFDVTDEIDGANLQNEPFGYSALNMLSELYIMFEEYEKPIQMIKVWSRRLQKRSHQTWWDDYKDDREFDTDMDDEELQASLGENRTRGLPVDLRVKLGICRLMLEEVKEAKAQFKYLWRCSVEDFPDLYEEIAELYVSKQMWKEAYNVIRAMLQYDEMDIPKTWIMAGECLRHMGQLKESKDYLEQAHRADPSSVDVSMVLAEVYEEMGNLPQALTLVNYVRQVNAEKQAEAERRRREARQAKMNKGAASTSAKGGQPGALGTAPQPYLDGSQQDAKLRQLAPRPGSSTSNIYISSIPWHLREAARGAMDRIKEASRSRAAAEMYTSADRDRDIQLLKSIREQERSEKLAERENQSLELREVIEKFNKIDAIYQRIDQKEKSRAWESKREAVRMTREDRTQYIQVARELINVFKNNRGFFSKEKNKPYTGVETRAWRYRRNAADADSGLSEHARDMSERLARAMGIGQSDPIVEEEEATQAAQVPIPTTYKDVSFHVWYLLMIRQAVYLTYEDRYAEAAELLMVMFSANVFYSVPRRRSGIMLVLLSCAMWARDHGAIINAGRWVTNFGGHRPLPFKIFQGTFPPGPRNQHQIFVWSQNITHKFLKRHIARMRKAVGKGMQRRMRKVHTLYRKPRSVTVRGPNRAFDTLPQTISSPKKRLRTGNINDALDIPVSFPWKKATDVLASTSGTSDTNALRNQRSGDRAQDATTHITSATSAQLATSLGNKETVGEGSVQSTHSKGLSSYSPQKNSFTIVSQDSPFEESTDTVSTRLRKRPLEGDDESVGSVGIEATGGRSQGDGEQYEEINDEDDYDVNDELYKTDEEEDDDDDGETEWENETSAFSRSGSKAYGKVGRHKGSAVNDDDDFEDDDDEDDDNDNDDGEDDDDDDNYDDEGEDDAESAALRKRRSSAIKDSLGVNFDITSRKPNAENSGYMPIKPRFYTKELYPHFHIHMISMLGHILAHSRSHVGSATQFAECMDYAPHNPMIHLYLAIQFFNLSMQRTTQNRQVALTQGFVFFQNYYRLRRAGYGTLAFTEREKAIKAKGMPPPPPPIGSLHSIVGVQNETANWKVQASKMSMDAISADTSSTPLATSSITSPPSVATSSVVQSSTSTSAQVPASRPELASHPTGTQPQNPTATTPESTPTSTTTSEQLEDLPPLRQCEQEAEFNYARGFHQLGQNHLAMIHYRRVLELPSWRQVEREQQALRQEVAEKEKESRRKTRAGARALVSQMKLERARKIRELREDRLARGEQVGEEDELPEEEFDEDSDEEDDDGVSGEGLNDEDEEGNHAPRAQASRLRLADDEDPTDLKREAAFNLAKIYMQSGAMGEAQILMRKYCTF
ncbi:transcription factor TFIIIC subunit tfc4 [Mortierella sp. AD094]|nr:transcription factor TFIIIC subunit tfc4 [Mortierella sp. AD094]